MLLDQSFLGENDEPGQQTKAGTKVRQEKINW